MVRDRGVAVGSEHARHRVTKQHISEIPVDGWTEAEAMCGRWTWKVFEIGDERLVSYMRADLMCNLCAKKAGIELEPAPPPRPRPQKRCERTGCDNWLTGRQERWCSRVCWALGNGKVSWMWQILHHQQEGLCGICVLPLDVPTGFFDQQSEGGLNHTTPFEWLDDGVGGHYRSTRHLVEVDHVIPRADGGTNDPSNLRVAHQACNQAKKTRSLADYRARIGAFEDVVAERLEGVGDEARLILSEPAVRRLSAADSDREIASVQRPLPI